MKRLFTLLIVLCVSSLAYAQTDVRTRGSGGGQDQPSQPQTGKRRVNGRIVDANGEPLVGATVTVLNAASKNVITGGFTNANGEFDLQADATGSQLLRVNYVGYKIQEVSIDAQSAGLNISMQEDVLNLDEVVVVGFGESAKRDLTGSVSSISGADIQNLPVTSIENAIQGRVAGVTVNANSGKLGQGINVRIRGSSSVTASNQPLYVVDGLPIVSENQETLTGESTNPIADINFNDVESIEILKDAASASIYGARAANGVVLITTKKGKVGASRTNINYFIGFSNPTKLRKFLNAEQYTQLFNEAWNNELRDAWVNFGYGTPGNYDPAVLGNGEFGVPLSGVAIGTAAQNPDMTLLLGSPLYTINPSNRINTNWQKEIYKTNAPTQQIEINTSGGNEKTQFFLSGNFTEQFGIVRNNRFTRASGRLNLDHRFNDKVKVGASINLIRTFNDRVLNDNSFATYGQAVALAPITPFERPATGFAGTPVVNNRWRVDPVTGYENPFQYDGFAFSRAEVLRSISNFYANFEIIQGLSFRSEWGFDILDQRETQWFSGLTTTGAATNGFAYNATSRVINYNTNNYFTFNKNFAQEHDLNAAVGFTYLRQVNEFGSVSGGFLPSGSQFTGVSSAAVITGGTGGFTGYAFEAWFARATYKFKNRYILQGSVRYDGSSRFNPGTTYGIFPSVGLAWIATDEPWLKDVSFLSLLKVKASYGLTGNAEVGNFPGRALVGPTAVKTEPGVTRGTVAGNQNIKWETTSQFDVGFELGLFKDRVLLIVDYYRKDTRDLLLNTPVIAPSGSQTTLLNLGNLRNQGIEISVNTDNLRNSKLKWETNFQFSYNDNKITNLGGSIITAGRGSTNAAIEGQPIGVFYIPGYGGVRPSDGRALYYGPDGVSTTTYNFNNQRGVQGYSIPPINYGLRNTFKIYGFDAEIFFQGVAGNKVYNSAGIFMTTQLGNGFDNQTEDVMGRWQQPGDITNTPRANYVGFLAFNTTQNGARESTRYLYDGAFLRLKTVTLGYTLKSEWLRTIKLRTLRVYATGQNLMTWTKYPGEPEVNSLPGANIGGGQDFYTIPQVATYTFGVNIGF